MKTALITGPARGIGLATTDILCAQGWHVVMVDRDAEELTARAFERQSVTAAVHDISDPDQVDSMIAATLAARGQIDALVNNAGVADFGPIEQTTFARWRRVMDTNLDGAFLCTQAATPAPRPVAAQWLISPQSLVCAPRPCGWPMERRKLQSFI